MSDPSKQPPNCSQHSGHDRKTFDKEALPDKIGNSLRSLYDEVLKEEVPDDFLNLLREADDKSSEISK